MEFMNDSFMMDSIDVIPTPEHCKMVSPDGCQKISIDRVMIPLFMPQLCIHRHCSEEDKMKKLQLLKDNVFKIVRLTTERRDTLISQNISSLDHACHCPGDDCELGICKIMKSLLRHVKMCRREKKCCCPSCNLMIAIAIGHAKQCREMNCSVLFCSVISRKIKQQQEQRREQLHKLHQLHQSSRGRLYIESLL